MAASFRMWYLYFERDGVPTGPETLACIAQGGTQQWIPVPHLAAPLAATPT